MPADNIQTFTEDADRLISQFGSGKPAARYARIYAAFTVCQAHICCLKMSAANRWTGSLHPAEALFYLHLIKYHSMHRTRYHEKRTSGYLKEYLLPDPAILCNDSCQFRYFSML